VWPVVLLGVGFAVLLGLRIVFLLVLRRAEAGPRGVERGATDSHSAGVVRWHQHPEAPMKVVDGEKAGHQRPRGAETIETATKDEAHA
jgi:hypothetical protein